jgi:hypothetical protein
MQRHRSGLRNNKFLSIKIRQVWLLSRLDAGQKWAGPEEIAGKPV